MYNYYNYIQQILVKNRIVEYNLLGNPSTSSILYSGELPYNISYYKSFQNLPVEELEYSLSNWSEYISVNMTSPGLYGIELTNKLPIIDREGLNSIQVAFDASIVSQNISLQYPLSMQIWNFNSNRWESISISPLIDGGYPFYDSTQLNYDFWTWKDALTNNDKFRPGWNTINSSHLQTISFGDCFPNTNNEYGAWFNESIQTGGNFLLNQHIGAYDISLNNNWSKYRKFLYYNKNNFMSNKFQFNNIILNLSNFWTTTTNFPAPVSLDPPFNIYYTEEEFFEAFLNNNQEFKIRFITEKESINQQEASLCIGDFKTYVHTDSK